MPAAHHNFLIEQGTTWHRVLEYQNPDTTPYVLTGWTAVMQVRRRSGAAGDPVVELSTVGTGIELDGPAGTLTVSLTATETAALPAGRYVYDLEIASPSNEITRLVEGAFIVDPEVTT